jgi:tryptophanyl-tRNA synthetase
MVNFIQPIRAKATDLQNNQALLDKIIQQGAEKARESADKTIQLVRKAVLG